MQSLLARQLVLALCLLCLALLPAQHGLVQAARAAAKARTTRGDGDGDEEDGGNGGSEGGALGGDSDSGVDVGSLQKSLKEGGVDGLNRMLQAFQAMGKIGASAVMDHVKTDADGNTMYDFTGGAGGTTTPPPGSDLESGEAQPAAASANATAQAAPSGKNSQPQPAAGTAKEPQKAVAKPAAAFSGPHSHHQSVRRLGSKKGKAAKDISAPVAVPATRVAAAAAKSQAAAKARPASVAAPPAAAQPAPTAAAAAAAVPGVQPAPAADAAEPAAQPAPTAPAAPAAVPTSGSSAGQLTALFNGLEEVRRGVDTLVTLGLHDRGSHGEQGSGENAPETRQLVGQLQELREENERLRTELREQARRLDAVEDNESADHRKLEQVLEENESLQSKLTMVQRHKVSLRRNENDADHHGGHRVRTFFHSKGKAAEH